LVKLTVPVREPVVDGVNDTLMEQVPFTARAVPQLFDCPKSVAPAVTDTPLMVSDEEPVLVMVTAWAPLVEDTCCAAKVKAAGDRVAKPWMPVPDSEAV
jgi:hypothetical protein